MPCSMTSGRIVENLDCYNIAKLFRQLGISSNAPSRHA
jgi:hypothetical protein